ncbi:MAG: hypothetical protein QOG54_2167 [Actinomycetota bacterium]|jgi:uncharacterized protein YxjI|nr:hypothetical protein [Actinomycetota bacterium]
MTLLEANQLIVNQKAKLVELTNQYLIRDAEGNELGRVEQEGQSKLRKVLRFATRVDQFLTHHLSIYDASGTKVLALVRPSKVFKSRVVVTDGAGQPVGEIVQQNVFGKIRFDLLGAQGEKLGQIRAENWRAWNFSIVDGADREVARITKKFVGVGKAIFTTADNYIVDIEPSLTGALRTMTVAAACAVDTALKQDDRGLSPLDLLGG